MAESNGFVQPVVETRQRRDLFHLLSTLRNAE
jgi:hypothetical protein